MVTTKSECPDCGCPVQLEMWGVPPIEAAFHEEDGKFVYHDMTECIQFLALRVKHLLSRVEKLEAGYTNR